MTIFIDKQLKHIEFRVKGCNFFNRTKGREWLHQRKTVLLFFDRWGQC